LIDYAAAAYVSFAPLRAVTAAYAIIAC